MQAPLRATWAAIGIGHEKASVFWNTKGLPLSTQTPLLLPQEAFRCNTFSVDRIFFLTGNNFSVHMFTL